MKRQIKTTADGSTTLFIEEIDENYHSHHGAIQEAVHVFIKNGLEYLGTKKIRIFELGFGTGLNALLTLKRAKELGLDVEYLGLEAFPVELDLVSQLNYTELIGGTYTDEFYHMHEADWNTPILLNGFQLTKVDRKIQDFDTAGKKFDLIYFDAFGPRAQDEMWELPILLKMAEMLNPEGVLVTYCAQGQFKRHLKSLGFEIERLPGPPGKREMTRATLKK